MNNDEAKFILRGYRPGGRDAADATFADALEQARVDPALGAWFEREQAHDAAVAAKLSAIAPAAGLREAILAGGRVTRNPAKRWRVPAWLGLAASVAALIASGLFWLQPAHADEQPLTEFAMHFAAGPFRLTTQSDDLDQLRDWLAARRAPLPAQIPKGCSNLRSLGCRTVEYRGKDISLICFEQGREYHLFVARRADFPELPECGQPEFLANGKWASAHWTDAENHYVLASDAGTAALQRLL